MRFWGGDCSWGAGGGDHEFWPFGTSVYAMQSLSALHRAATTGGGCRACTWKPHLVFALRTAQKDNPRRVISVGLPDTAAGSGGHPSLFGALAHPETCFHPLTAVLGGKALRLQQRM